MNKRTLRILEYNKILEMLSEYAASSMAKKRCTRIKPSKDLAEITQFQEETRDALLRISLHGSISFAGLTDIGQSLKLLEIESALSSRELLDIASVLEAAARVKQYGDNLTNNKNDAVSKVANAGDDEVKTDSLTNRFSELTPLSDISSEIRRCILAEDEIADDASSNLKSIRRNIQMTNEKLHSELAKMVKSDEHRTYLQDSLVTMRNGRYCIPVKQEYRNHIPGMIHDQSSSGSTLFIEPMQIVNLNNKIKELATEEHIEIEKILTNLSLMAGSAVEDISIDMRVLTDLDFIFAKAKFAKSLNANQPIFNTDGIIDIKQGRHPLLDKHTVVPVDIKLGEDYTLLIITGPNTGGKTVSLKTLGLFTLMGQSGLHIPAQYGSKLSVFDDVFADIGDEQSIEQNLSTFSSHMSNIIYIVNHASPNTLCLFDEPGGGTDPVEGAALAISILTHLKDIGARCMATTHYSELKTFALSTPLVMNASCEFDVASLKPTYKLMIGIPGKSNAFAISKRLGLPEFIIDDAASRIDRSDVEMETIISALAEDRKKAEEARIEAETYKKEVETLKKRLSAKEEELNQKKADILNKAREEAKDIIDEAKEVADSAIRDYNKWRANPNKANIQSMEEKRNKIRDKQKSLDNGASKKAPATSGHTAKDFSVGDHVQIISLGSSGTIIELPDAKNTVLVQIGIFKSRLPISDVLITESANARSANNIKKLAGGSRKTEANSFSFNKALTFKPEINLLGKTVDEAVMEIDKFLDDAMLTHTSPVRIVHGKGSGALRKGVHEYLRRLSYVKSYKLAEYGEGDAGVTIVELKS